MLFDEKRSPDFFVVGTPNSGTTWMMDILNTHPHIACYNEFGTMDKLKDGLAELFGEITAKQLKDKQKIFQEFDYPQPSFAKEDIDETIKLIWNNLIERTPYAKYVGERTNKNMNNLYDMIKIFPKTKIIHVVRDPRDVAYSWFQHRVREFNLGQNDVPPNDSVVYVDAITQWRKDQLEISAIKKSFSDNFITIRYEEMNDAEEVNRVFEFLGAPNSVEFTQECIEKNHFSKKRKMEHTFFATARSGHYEDAFDDEFIEYANSLLSVPVDLLKKYNYK